MKPLLALRTAYFHVRQATLPLRYHRTQLYLAEFLGLVCNGRELTRKRLRTGVRPFEEPNSDPYADH
jgi:hypothetical protein